MAQSMTAPKLLKNSPLQFEIISECGKSRCRYAKLTLPHHSLETPTFMPVGTQGTVKGLLPEQVEAAGADIILGNTYHLGTRPGKEVLSTAGGLHKWMSWNRGMLTDSGGFQMVSLLKLAKITEDGVTFQSPYDGSQCLLTPEESIQIQNSIGADIMMQLDDVVDVRETNYERFKEATYRTTRWLDRCISANTNHASQNLFPIVQGGLFRDLRELSCHQLVEREAPGYAIGGLSGGEDKDKFWPTVEQCTGLLPVNKPRYCMGVGFAPDLVVCTALGVDMFDCVYPTRTARFGCALVATGQISLKMEKYSHDFAPIDESCNCSTCLNYTKAYINASLRGKNSVGCHLLSVHNIAYQMRLMKSIRESVKDNKFPEFAQNFMETFYEDKEIPVWITDALASVDIHFDNQKVETKTNKEIYLKKRDLSKCSEDSDEDGILDSGFESRAFDLGFRETLRQDYPEQEEEGRVDGYSEVFRENSGLNLISVGELVNKYSSLEGALTLLLYKHQTDMSEDNLREIVTIRNEIKERIDKLNISDKEQLNKSLEDRLYMWKNDSTHNAELQSFENLSIVNENISDNIIKKIEEATANYELLLKISRNIASKFNWNISNFNMNVD